MPGGRVGPSTHTSMHTGRMSQTSIERLRDYLAQLPPQAQALLMREFERAIERGEDTTVATFVLEQLRKVVRGTDEDAQAAHRRSGAAGVPAARAVSRRRQFCSTAGPDPPRVAAAGVAMADPRRRARAGARIRSGAGADAGNRIRPRTRSRRSANSSSPPRTRSSRSPSRWPAATSSGRWRASGHRTWSRTCCRSARFCRPAKRWTPLTAGFPVTCGFSRSRRSPRSAAR